MPLVGVQTAITEIIARGEAEDNYLICNCTSTSEIRILYRAQFKNLYHFQLCWILEGLDTFSITLDSHNCLESFLLGIF